jgi:hypothetical protein
MFTFPCSYLLLLLVLARAIITLSEGPELSQAQYDRSGYFVLLMHMERTFEL